MHPIRPLTFLALLTLAPAAAAQDDVRPPRAEPVAEDDAGDPEPMAEDDADDFSTTPRAEPVPEPADAEPDAPKAEIVPDPAPMPRDTPEEAREVRAVPADPAMPKPVPRAAPPADPSQIDVALNTDPNARPVSLRAPAPRGLIVDRNGKPLAQNRVAHYIGVEFPLEEGLSDAAVLAAVRPRITFCSSQMSEPWNPTDAELVEHYHKRRWIPMYHSGLVPDETAAAIAKSLPQGVILRPFFLRTYPEKSFAGHLIGQMGKSGGFASGDLAPEELMWPPTVGRAGLEKRFDKELTGSPGLYTALYDARGSRLAEEWRERPRAGHTVVTTLDMDSQAIVERNLRERGVRGAFVIMNVHTGDIVAMASTPAPDPNDWVHGIGDATYRKLVEDPDKILYCRATQGLYPPASTFKIVTALAALETDKVDPDTYYNCSKGMYFGRTWMWNHSHRDEGPMNVVRAIKRSCNTWFFQAARAGGASSLSSMGSLLGFGDKTGICLEEMEVPGRMPTPEYYQKRGGAMTGGVLANVSIGQGEVESTPLQVCQMMAAVARGDAVPRPRLVKQIQDVDGKIVQHFPPSVRATLTLQKENLEAVRKGMRAVVADGDGTGTRASNRYVAIAGKTGTGQWQPAKRQYVAWFAGFIPAAKPEFAYACLYEGDPGEDEISGGRKVAPIVGDVFNEIYRARNRKGEIKDDEKGEGETDDEGSDKPRRRRDNSEGAAEAAPAAQPAAPEPAPRRGGLRGFFDRIRRKDAAPQPAPGQPPSPFRR